MTSEDHTEFWGRVREQVPGLPSAPPPAWAFGATAEHAHAEGEGGRTLEDWRRGRKAFWGEFGARGFAPDMPVVCERFRLIHPAPPA